MMPRREVRAAIRKRQAVATTAARKERKGMRKRKGARVRAGCSEPRVCFAKHTYTRVVT